MDFQAMTDMADANAAVLSVEETENGNIGDIRIVCANNRYKEIMGAEAYYDGMLYYELIQRELKFEDFCYRAAFGKQRLQTYVQTEGLDDTWTDMSLTPLKGGTDKLKYVLFMFDFTKTADPELMAQSVSIDTASAVMRCCLKLTGAEDFNDGVQAVVEDLMEEAGAMACRITLVDHKNKEAVNFCESIAQGYDLDDYEGDGEISYETAASWEGMIGDQNIIIAANDYEMDYLESRNPEWVREMRSYDVESIVMLPLKCDREVIGYLYVINFNKDDLVEIKELIEMMAFILGSEIFTFQTIKKLERLSVEDELTGLYNRNAMNRRIADLIDDPEMLPFGVVNMDLNGLKQVNDTKGHDAGDELLRDTSDFLKGIFAEDELYRAGGDEFIALVIDSDKNSFDKKMKRLHDEEARDERFNLAIGSFWAVTEEDADSAFVKADMRMYSDKKAYYAAHPEKERRKF